MMNKAEELDILRRAAAKLGSASYCGPWLTRIIPQIERDIRSDNPPDTPTPAEVAAAMVAQGKSDAALIVWEARAEARRILAAAEETLQQAQECRDRVARAAAAAKRDIDAVVTTLTALL